MFQKSIRLLLLCTLMMTVAACSSPNKQSIVDPETGKHLANWYVDHRSAFISSPDRCNECHGTDLRGGVSGISCFSASYNGMTCHANGPSGHPAGWADPTLHGVTAEQNFAACKVCHGAGYQGGVAATTCYQCHNGPGLNHPAPAWVVPDHKTAALADSVICRKCHGTDYLGGGSHIACADCHMEDRTKVHPLAWYPDVQLNHRVYAAANGTAACSNSYCHGANLAGVAQSGPSCSTCHSWPFTSGTCGSCHGIPPAGTTFPNIAGRHSAHTALNPNIVCETCHQGAGSGTALHLNGVADVIIGAAYNAKIGGAAFYNAAGDTCSNVSCHGGQTTPVWLTGSIDVNTQCASCHRPRTTSDQYNSQFSGRHSAHSFALCTECHDTARLSAVHFNDLDTQAMTNAYQTMLNSLNYTGAGGGSYGTCTVTCHGETHTGRNW